MRCIYKPKAASPAFACALALGLVSLAAAPRALAGPSQPAPLNEPAPPVTLGHITNLGVSTGYDPLLRDDGVALLMQPAAPGSSWSLDLYDTAAATASTLQLPHTRNVWTSHLDVDGTLILAGETRDPNHADTPFTPGLTRIAPDNTITYQHNTSYTLPLPPDAFPAVPSEGFHTFNSFTSNGYVVGSGAFTLSENASFPDWLPYRFYAGSDTLDLLHTPSDWLHAEVRAVNSVGHAVGTGQSLDGAAYIDTPFLWTQAGTIVELNSLLPDDSPWQIVSATDINDAGVIVGTADYLGVRTTYALDLDYAPHAHHPSPGGLALLACAGLFALSRQR